MATTPANKRDEGKSLQWLKRGPYSLFLRYLWYTLEDKKRLMDSMTWEDLEGPNPTEGEAEALARSYARLTSGHIDNEGLVLELTTSTPNSRWVL